jgi:hypothetical protein
MLRHLVVQLAGIVQLSPRCLVDDGDTLGIAQVRYLHMFLDLFQRPRVRFVPIQIRAIFTSEPDKFCNNDAIAFVRLAYLLTAVEAMAW